METAMVSDIILQIGLVLLGVFLFLAIHDVPQKALAKLRRRPSHAKVQAKRHFVRGAQLLSQATSSSSSSAAAAVDEAEKSLALDPTDAAAHVLKALALDFQGFRTSALESIDAALAPLASGSLSGSERSDALLKRAELKQAADRPELLDSAAEDLKEAARLNPKNAKAYCALGAYYENKEVGAAEARAAFEAALLAEPGSAVARQALDRLGS